MGHGNSKFNQKVAERIFDLAKKGKTDEQIAKIIGISSRTLRNWKVREDDFLPALKESKGVADDLVEAALFSRATGYTHKEEKVFMYKGEIITHWTEKHYPPDPVAAIYWLNNRRSDEWSNKSYIQQFSPTKTDQPKQKRTFSEFCVQAGYPAPYPKQEEMRDFAMTDGDPRILLGSRGYGKTDYVTVMGTAYDIYSNCFDGLHLDKESATSNLIISKSKSRNAAMIDEIANALEKNGIRLSTRNTTKIRIEGLAGKDDSVEMLTIKSSFRGRHPKRILMDDPVTEEDTSEAMRTLVKKKYNEAYKLSKNIVIIGQPAHAFDLYADLRGQLNILEIPHGSIVELDADLEAMKLAGVDEKSIEMSYMLRVPKDGSSPFDNIKYIDFFPTGGTSVAFIDPSDGGDQTSVSIFKQYGQGMAVLGLTWKRAWHHCLDDLKTVFAEHGVGKVCFETNKHGTQALDVLRTVFTTIGVVGRNSNSNKHSRIMAAGTFAHHIHLAKTSHANYIKWVTQYELGAKVDDPPDSLATGLEWIGLIRGKQ